MMRLRSSCLCVCSGRWWPLWLSWSWWCFPATVLCSSVAMPLITMDSGYRRTIAKTSSVSGYWYCVCVCVDTLPAKNLPCDWCHLCAADVFRCRTAWLFTPRGSPLPLSSTSHWFLTCGVWTATPRQQPHSASCLERCWDGELWLDEVTWGLITLCVLHDCWRSVLTCRFIVENWVLDRWVRNILTVYPVVIVALVGNIARHYHAADPTTNSVFMSEFNVLFIKWSTDTQQFTPWARKTWIMVGRCLQQAKREKEG